MDQRIGISAKTTGFTQKRKDSLFSDFMQRTCLQPDIRQFQKAAERILPGSDLDPQKISRTG